MGEQYRHQLAEVPMTETWRQWQGQTVEGEFPLREYLGGSAHAAVFLTDSGREEPQTAAIKLIAESSDAERQVESWRLARTLSHPNLLRIFRFGRCQISDQKLLYVVMERADEALSQIIPQRALSESEATEMLKPALDALAHLHEKGLLHGRVKPSNILAQGDQLKLSTDGLHRAGEAVIDPGNYDPPEANFSTAGDVWSLGMTLVEVLTQQLPAWDRNAQADPKVSETLPPPLLDIVRHCLFRDSSRRWTVSDIANRLNPMAAVPAAPPTATRPAPVQRSAQPLRRSAPPSKSRYLIPAVIFLLALTGFVSLKLLNRSAQSVVEPSQEAKRSSGDVSRATQQAQSAAPPVSAGREATPIAKPIEEPVEQQSSASERTPPLPPLAPPAPAPKLSQTSASAGVVHQVMPDVPQKARNTIRGTVRVGIRVSVDPSGNVTNAAIDSRGPSQYFANLALQAAQQWKFASAGNASSDWIIHFEFLTDGTNASASPDS